MDISKIILRKLYRRRVIGGKHTAVEHLTKGMPRHAAGMAKDVVKELIKEGFMPKAKRVFSRQPTKKPHLERRDFFLNEIRKKFALRVLDARRVLNFFCAKNV